MIFGKLEMDSPKELSACVRKTDLVLISEINVAEIFSLSLSFSSKFKTRSNVLLGCVANDMKVQPSI